MRVHLVVLIAMLMVGCTASPPPEESETAPTPVATSPTPSATTPPPIATTPTLGFENVTVSAGEVIEPTPAPMPDPAPAPAPAPADPAPAPAPAPADPAPAPAPADPTPPPPPAPPTPAPTPPPTWPREGSYVTYAARWGQSFGGSDQFTETFTNLSWTYTNGDWRGECVAHTREDLDGDGVAEDHDTRTTYSASSPPHWPLFNTRSPPAIGQDVTAWTARSCTLESDTWTYAGESSGVHTAESGPEDVPYEFRTRWSATSGLVLEWSLVKGQSSAPSTNHGILTDTDAPRP